MNDVKKDAVKYGVLSCCQFFENIPHAEVARILRNSKVCAMLSKAEGANRAIYEALFSGVPIVVCRDNIGVNRAHVNEHTGAFASDEELDRVIERMIAGYAAYDTRTWALANTGYVNATRVVNDTLKRLALEAGEPWTQDICPKKNGPNLLYVSEEDRLAMEPEYKRLEAYLDL